MPSTAHSAVAKVRNRRVSSQGLRFACALLCRCRCYPQAARPKSEQRQQRHERPTAVDGCACWLLR